MLIFLLKEYITVKRSDLFNIQGEIKSWTTGLLIIYTECNREKNYVKLKTR